LTGEAREKIAADYSLVWLESLRMTSPAPSNVPPPAARRTTSRPVNGSVLELVVVVVVVVVGVFEAVLLATEQSCGL
jgi:hypothetical protein